MSRPAGLLADSLAGPHTGLPAGLLRPFSSPTPRHVMLRLFRNWHIRRLLREELSPQQLQWLNERISIRARLRPEQLRRHEAIVRVMIARCPWEGCEGLQVTDEMRTLIAGHAAVMLLGADNYYFDSVNAILVFPGVIQRKDSEDPMTLGEAWSNGGIVLSWPEVRATTYHRGARNVVIHEFAHHLDGLDGEMGGSIPFRGTDDQRRWHEISTREYERLVEDVRRDRPTVLDPYGATNPAEFFAVASECFFERPDRLRSHHAELFESLGRFYGFDPS
ncbi:MAG: hypothetical protein EA381_11440 [Planctomycetaceae bacterium]|nr:MAG: hypothetical protein EA381_11440 [Planctomycetaceae bacterium]